MYFFFFIVFSFFPQRWEMADIFFLSSQCGWEFYILVERKRKTDVYENGRQSSRRKNNNSEIPVFLLFCLPVC